MRENSNLIDVRISSRNWVYYSHLICGQDHEKKLGLDFLLVPIQGCDVVWLANMFFLASLRFGKNDQPMYSNKDFAPKGQFFPSHALEKLSTLRRISREMKIFSAAQFLYIWSKNSHELEEFRFGRHNSQYAYKKKGSGLLEFEEEEPKKEEFFISCSAIARWWSTPHMKQTSHQQRLFKYLITVHAFPYQKESFHSYIEYSNWY